MKHSLVCTLRGFGLALVLTSAGAQAQAPIQANQVPGYYRLAVGDYEVTALFDGLQRSFTEAAAGHEPGSDPRAARPSCD